MNLKVSSSNRSKKLINLYLDVLILKKKKRLKLLKSEIKMGTLLFYRNKKDYKSVLYPNKLDNVHGQIPRNTKPIL